MSNEDRLKWLKERQKGIGGSDIGALLGVNYWKSSFNIYLDKTEEITESDEGSEFTYWGNQLEDLVAKEFAKRTGKKVRRDTVHYVHREYPFMVANIDRRIVGEDALLECKTTSAYNAKEWDGDEIPASYILQVQHYLSVTGFKKAYIACLIGGNKFIWKEIEKDYELIKIIESTCYEFWNNHVIPRIPPMLDGSESADNYLKSKYNKSNGNTIQLESRYYDLIEDYKKAKEMQKTFENESKSIENMIKQELGENEAGEVRNYKITWKPITSNRVDSTALKIKYPDVYKEVIKESSYRKFGLLERKEE